MGRSYNLNPKAMNHLHAPSPLHCISQREVASKMQGSISGAQSCCAHCCLHACLPGRLQTYIGISQSPNMTKMVTSISSL